MKFKRITALFLSLAVGSAAFGNVSAEEAEKTPAEEAFLSGDEDTVSGSAAEAEIETEAGLPEEDAGTEEAGLSKETEAVISADLSYSSVSLASLNTRVNRIQTCTPGDTVENAYLKIVPTSEINYGDSIILNFTNAVVLDEIEAYEDSQYSKSYDTLISQYLSAGATSSAAKKVLDIIWSDNTDDVYIPWQIIRLSDTSVQVQLFPVPSAYCNVNYNSYGHSSKPYYYLPLPVQVSNTGTASVTLSTTAETGGSLDLAYVVANEGDNTTAFITGSPNSSYTYLNRVAAVASGECLTNYLHIIPMDAVEMGDSITLSFENAYVPDDLPAFEDNQYTTGFDSLSAMYTAAGSNSSAAKRVLDAIWLDAMDDVFIPWKMTKLSDTSIKVELFPVPSTYCDIIYTSYGYANKPYYYLPLEVYASGSGSVSLTVNHNGSPVSGGIISTAANINSSTTDSSVSLSSLNARVNRIQTYTPGDTVKNAYLKIIPKSGINYGDTITLNFTNSSVLDDIEAFEDNQYSQSYDTLAAQYLSNTIGGSYAAKRVLDNIWSDVIDDVYIPWKLTKLSDTSIKAELFPVPSAYCNVNYNSYGHSSKPYYYLPLPVQVSSTGTASVSISTEGETGDSLDLAYVVANEGDDTTAYITGSPNSSYTYLDRVVTADSGEILTNYLHIIPMDTVEQGDTITLTFTNAYVPDDLPTYEDYQGNGSSYDKCTAALEAGMVSKSVLDTLWASLLDDVYIPWKMTKLSDTSIKVELFPIPSMYCDTTYTSFGYANKPYYFIPLEVYANSSGSVSLTVNHNGSPISGGIISKIASVGSSGASTTETTTVTTTESTTETTTESTTATTTETTTVTTTESTTETTTVTTTESTTETTTVTAAESTTEAEPSSETTTEGEFVSPPAFGVAGVFGGRAVTFTSETDGAVIYYSSTSSTLTTDDISVSNGETVLFEDFYGTLYARAYYNGSWSNVSRLILKIPVVNTPTVTASGSTVTVKSTTPSSFICYTTDGSEPVIETDGTVTNGTWLRVNGARTNSGTITAEPGDTVRAVAVRNCFTTSASAAAYVSVSPAAFTVVGTFGGRNVTFNSDTAGAKIYYSSTTSSLTTSDKCVSNGETVLFEDFYGTIYARAYYNGKWSNVSRLILKIPTINDPTITYSGGKATIRTTTPNCYIYYTTDGSAPSITNGKKLCSNSYGQITVSSGTTIKAIAVRSCFTNSTVVTYTVS